MLDLEGSVILFSLILMRMTGCIFFNPLLGRSNIPILVKSGIIMVLTFFVYSFSAPVSVDASNVIGYGVLLLKELAVGYAIGAVFNFFIGALIFAGSVIDFQMGLSMATIYDPQSNSSVSVTANLLNMIFFVCFLASDAHLVLLKIFLTSAEIVPYGSIALGTEAAAAGLRFFAEFMELVFRIAMPMMAVELFVEVGVGILMKAIPQINIFVVNIQVKILVGLALLLILFFPMADFLIGGMDTLMQRMKDMLAAMSG